MSSKVPRRVSRIVLTSSMACWTAMGDAGRSGRGAAGGISLSRGAGSATGATGSAPSSTGGGGSWASCGGGRRPEPLRPRPPRRPRRRGCEDADPSDGAGAGSGACSGAMPQIAPYSPKCNANNATDTPGAHTRLAGKARTPRRRGIRLAWSAAGPAAAGPNVRWGIKVIASRRAAAGPAALR